MAPDLPVNEVHVWRVLLHPEPVLALNLKRTLSADELAKAAKFKFQLDRDRYIAARASLRAILGRYLDVDSAEIRFAYGENGKPMLSVAPEKSTLQFNLSHSHRLALVAVTRGREVGIDIEHVREDFNIESVSKQFFCAAEKAALRRLSECKRREAFFQLWTCKEAYIKATGKGLSLAPYAFEVKLPTADEPARLHIPDDPRESSRWSLRVLAPGLGYVAAVAAVSNDWKLYLWRWPKDAEGSDEKPLAIPREMNKLPP